MRITDALGGVLKVRRSGEDSGGTGVIISRAPRHDRLIAVTNHHVAHVGDSVTVNTFGSKQLFSGEVIWSDRASDLSLISYQGQGYPLQVSPFLPYIGQDVYTVGHPMGKPTMSKGIVSNVGVKIGLPGAAESMVNLIQTDAWVAKGFSGGPLLGIYEGVPVVYGVISSFIPFTRMGFAVPATTVWKIVDTPLMKYLEAL